MDVFVIPYLMVPRIKYLKDKTIYTMIDFNLNIYILFIFLELKLYIVFALGTDAVNGLIGNPVRIRYCPRNCKC